MKVTSKKRNEGRKAETKTSDKENESVQRKWPGGVAPRGIPHCLVFPLFSATGEGGQLTHWAVTSSSPRARGSWRLWEGRPPPVSLEKGHQPRAQSTGLEAGPAVSCWVPRGHHGPVSSLGNGYSRLRPQHCGKDFPSRGLVRGDRHGAACAWGSRREAGAAGPRASGWTREEPPPSRSLSDFI